jgi:CHAT domain-containing protein
MTVGEAVSAPAMSLAQAFLAAGARAVVAPTRDVADADAQSFMATFYKNLAVHGLSALRQAFRSAALEAVGRSSQSFRLIVQ